MKKSELTWILDPMKQIEARVDKINEAIKERSVNKNCSGRFIYHTIDCVIEPTYNEGELDGYSIELNSPLIRKKYGMPLGYVIRPCVSDFWKERAQLLNFLNGIEFILDVYADL